MTAAHRLEQLDNQIVDHWRALELAASPDVGDNLGIDIFVRATEAPLKQVPSTLIAARAALILAAGGNK